MDYDVGGEYQIGVGRGALTAEFQSKCWADVKIDRLEHGLGLRSDLDGAGPEAVNREQQTNCPPDGSSEMDNKINKIDNLNRETDELFRQRRAITLG